MRVAWRWHDIIRRSTAIHDRRILAPREKLLRRNDMQPSSADTSTYDDDSGIQFHRGLVFTKEYCVSHSSVNEVIDLHHFDTRDAASFVNSHLLVKHGDFATTPPCQVLGVGEDAYTAIVYVRDGIRIWDLQKLASSFIERSSGFVELDGNLQHVMDISFRTARFVMAKEQGATLEVSRAGLGAGTTKYTLELISAVYQTPERFIVLGEDF